MSFKKRLKNFVSNWLGVIIATVIVIISATFGGMYLYARSRVDNSINFTTQAITLRPVNGLTQTGTTDTPPGYIYDIVLQVFNPYADTVNISISGATITLDTYTLPIEPDGSWDVAAPTGYQYFEGLITIDKQTFASLVAKGSVDVYIKGTISGSGQYKWVKRHAQRPFIIPLPGVLFRYTS
jgi:hypothetical protein